MKSTLKNTFSEFHPTVQLVFFTSVLTLTMFIRQPVFLTISIGTSFLYAYYLGRGKALKTTLFYILPMFVLISAINPLFNHAGVTILFYLPDGNALTLESIIFGAVSALMLSSVILWCMSMRLIMTSDRMIYLFGRIAPKLSLLISMILRFIPKLASRFQQVRAARRSIGRDVNSGNLFRRMSNAVKIFSSMLQWAMENSIDTADSLKSRGYGLPHRTSFTLFHFEKRDAAVMIFMLACDTAITAANVSGMLTFDYFPSVSEIQFGTVTIFYIIYTVLCIIPLMIDKKGDKKWKALRSQI